MKKSILSVLGLGFFVLLFVLLLDSPLVATEKIKFSERKIILGKSSLIVEIADTPERSARGLMYRKDLPEGRGMLFVFPDQDIRNFWMKNTFIPLSIGFFDQNMKLVDMQDMEPVKSEMDQSPPNYSSRAPAKYGLEVRRGWFVHHKIKLGDTFKFEK